MTPPGLRGLGVVESDHAAFVGGVNCGRNLFDEVVELKLLAPESFQLQMFICDVPRKAARMNKAPVLIE